LHFGLETDIRSFGLTTLLSRRGYRLGGADGATQVASYVVSGIGFLGAGVIMREEGNVRGLNTAATLWCSAAVGACAGADLIPEAVLATLFVVCANTLLRPVVDRINRKPIDTASVEVTNTVELQAPTKALDVVKPTQTLEPAATEGPQEFYTEEFDVDPGPNWAFYVIRGNNSSDKSKVATSFENGKMIFDIDDKELYAYYMYEPFSYTDVSLDMQAENQGKNTNNVSLVCRQNSNDWYEFSITSGGLWVLYAHNSDGYNWMANGGTTALHMGKDVNEFGMICKGNSITMSVNGKELKTIKDNTYKFDEGTVGFNISSLDVIPVTVAVEYMDISQP